ncbi:uncharacterized protein YabE (DUF348 family)/3D (Asp-Asp-Asp) domain-containing protein [Virgibacillus halotolerans]|uniref:G5 and 3D domain-containing protein n=1 Tax=Virgibacillus halotolerans TaxID=1071053 RepID=UPI001960D2EE|nr:G5 and 3D domain-containing protein [Virgibacillus halotolerans]MBM7601308.1 uncharacterized protein YabE (DUF348 family)/3D (Asp-Asp-Asp) domain-containing protein [Virgibacillus halotolerans]
MRIFSKLLPASKMKLVISGIGVLALLVFAGILLFEATKAEVVVTDNGEQQTVKTHQDTVKDLLTEVGIAVEEHDAISPRLDAPVEDGMTIDYRAAREIFVTVDGDKQKYYTTTDTVEDFLSEQNLSFTAHDDVSSKMTEATKDGLHIEVTKAYEVTINDGGKKKKVWTTGGTVGELLNDSDIKFDKKLDKIKPGIKKDVTADTAISVVRVEKTSDEVTENIDFGTVTKEDSSLEQGKEEVVSEGKPGTLVKKFEVTKENGKEVNRELTEKEVKEESKDRVVAIGAKEPEPEPEEKQKVVQLSESKPKPESKPKSESKQQPKAAPEKGSESKPDKSKSSSSNNGGKVYQMNSTAYTGSCNGCSGVTATGIDLNANPNMKVIAVDPNVIPLGSKVWVEGYGEAIAGDTGGSIVGNRIDVHVSSKSAANSWGRKTVQVKVLH